MMLKSHFDPSKTYDVVICGGGLSGLCLAKQLRLTDKEISILVLDSLRRPLPEAAFKVGESTIEAGAYYYENVLNLSNHLHTSHLKKLGLRYFYKGGSSNEDLINRPEYGISRFPPANSFQIDRGRLESHLRSQVEDSGVTLLEGVRVSNIEIDRQSGHVITWHQESNQQEIRGRWVIDAMGRRKFLQKRLGFTKESEGTFNSAWFRVRGKLSISSFVSAEHRDWHNRAKDDRWHSTTHLMGPGYWVWLIPLAPSNTSIGIVANDEMHPFHTYNTYEKALLWLNANEPLVAKHLEKHELIDFLKLKDYSYSSERVYSMDRWACIGEAAGFADPYYSVGSNMIAFGNGFVKEIIQRDRIGALEEGYIGYANQFFLSMLDGLTNIIHRAYPFLGNAPVMALKTIWDTYIAWCVTDPQLYYESYLDPNSTALLNRIVSPIVGAQSRLIKLFEDWAQLGSSLTFSYIDNIDHQPTLLRLLTAILPTHDRGLREYVEILTEAVARLEELAMVIFLIAVRDVHPNLSNRFAGKVWINIGAISLIPDQWESDGLFKPNSTPRSLECLESEISVLFSTVSS